MNHYDELKAMGRLHQERNNNSTKELEAARIKEAHGSQVVAHLSEKVFYLKVLKKELVEKTGDVDSHLAHQREKLNRVKIERDKARKEVGEIKERTGIMFSPHLLHDLEKKVKIRNNLIRQLLKANQFVSELLAKTRHGMPRNWNAEKHFRKMARGNLPLLPEEVDDEEKMNVICSYDGTSHEKHDDGGRTQSTAAGKEKQSVYYRV